MKSQWVPYATTPGRLMSQLFSDAVVIVWTTIWVFVGMAVHSAVATIADFGYRVEGGANGVAGNLYSAGDSIDGFRFRLADTSWLLIRFSGTEPVLRIYAETSSPERVERLLSEGRRLTGI